MSAESFDAMVARLERALDEVERGLSGEPLASSRELVRAVLDVHRAAVSDLLAGARGAGIELPREILRRPAVAWLLALHDLTPDSIADRAREAVRDALDTAREGASAELVSAEEGEVRVRLGGESPDAVARLRRDVERAVLRLAPEAVLSFEDPFAERDGQVAHLLPAERLVRRPVER
jgi:hypothetical protein